MLIIPNPPQDSIHVRSPQSFPGARMIKTARSLLEVAAKQDGRASGLSTIRLETTLGNSDHAGLTAERISYFDKADKRIGLAAIDPIPGCLQTEHILRNDLALLRAVAAAEASGSPTQRLILSVSRSFAVLRTYREKTPATVTVFPRSRSSFGLPTNALRILHPLGARLADGQAALLFDASPSTSDLSASESALGTALLEAHPDLQKDWEPGSDGPVLVLRRQAWLLVAKPSSEWKRTSWHGPSERSDPAVLRILAGTIIPAQHAL